MAWAASELDREFFRELQGREVAFLGDHAITVLQETRLLEILSKIQLSEIIHSKILCQYHSGEIIRYMG